MNDYSQYQLISDIFRYPSTDLLTKMKNCQESLNQQYPGLRNDLDKFAEWIEMTPLDEMEEVYTKTFHIQAICYLDLGYVIFGEDYKRGEFLVNMKREQHDAMNHCGDELPDNLVNILTLIPKLKDNDIRNELAVRVVIPALHKMLDEFKSARMELKTKALRKKHKAILMENQRNGNIYQFALRALLEVFNQDFEGIQYDEVEKDLDLSVSGFEAAACGSCSFINTKSLKFPRT